MKNSYPTKTILICSIPALICLLLLGIYLVSPDFYLRYILEENLRERGVVEITTWISAFTSALFLFAAAWKQRANIVPFQQQSAIVLLLVVGLAAFFFAGEEVSWGQTWFGWETPEAYESVETNIHNNQVLKRMGININSLGSLFMFLVFAVYPLVSKSWKNKPAFFQPLEKTVPGPLAISFVLTGFIWKESKNIYRAFTTEAQQAASTFYMQFLEQINEQKEMLLAIGLLVYGLQMWRQTIKKQ